MVEKDSGAFGFKTRKLWLNWLIWFTLWGRAKPQLFVVPTLMAGRTEVKLTAKKRKRILFSPKHPNRPSAPPSLIFSAYGNAFLRTRLIILYRNHEKLMRHNLAIDVRISKLGKRLWGIYSFALAPAGIRTTYRPVHSLYCTILFFFIIGGRLDGYMWNIDDSCNLYASGILITPFFYYINMFQCHNLYNCWSQWPHGLRRGSATTCLLGLQFRIQPRACKFVFCDRCVLSGRDICFGLITCPEEPYRVWCVWVRSSSSVRPGHNSEFGRSIT
jgi:hypothetical protein